MSYQREKAVAYAHKWAMGRNSAYYNFDDIGGDCTNFVSQCLYAGCGVMNYKRDLGWYYNSLNDRSAAWTGVPYLYQFLTSNKGPGPYGSEVPVEEVEAGDIAQLSFDGEKFAHSLLITQTGLVPALWNIRVSTHTFDADNRLLSSYFFEKIRFIHIEGSRG